MPPAVPVIPAKKSVIPAQTGIQTGYLFLFLLIAVANGGREIVGLALYQLGSLLLILFWMNQDPAANRLPKNFSVIPLFIFLFISLLSAIYSMVTRSRGLVQFSTILIHAANFGILDRAMDENFSKKFLYFLALICSLFSTVTLILLGTGSMPASSFPFLPNADLFLGFLACGMAPAYVMLTGADGAWSYKIFLSYTILAGFAVQILLFSRGALLSLILVLAFLILLLWRKYLIHIGAVMILMLLTIIVIPGILKPLADKIVSLSVSGGSVAGHIPGTMEVIASKIMTTLNDDRITVWRGSLRSFLKKPLFGWGLGSFGQVYQLHRVPFEQDIGRYAKTTPFAHNEYLQIAVEMGAIGLLSFIVLIFSLLKEGGRLLKKDDDDHWIRLSAIAGISVILIISLFDFNLHLPLIAFLFVFFSAILTNKTTVKQSPLMVSLSNHERQCSFALKYFVRPLVILWIAMDVSVLSSQCFGNIALKEKDGGQKSLAISHFEIAVALNPFQFEFLNELANLNDDPKIKEKYLRRAIFANPGDSSLYSGLARAHLAQSRIEDAVQDYKNAILKNPKDPFYYSELGEIFIQKNQFPAAIALYRKAVQIEPLYVFGHFRLGKLEQIIGEKNLALQSFQNARKIMTMSLKPESDYDRRLLEPPTWKNR